jgi:hypothetical protein
VVQASKQNSKKIDTSPARFIKSLELFVICVTMRNFDLWLDEEVWVSNSEKGTRREYIPFFADALTLFMKQKGYKMCAEWGKGHRIVARWMYIIHRDELIYKAHDKKIKYPNSYHRDWEEDFDEYQHIITHDTISTFMKNWELYEDFDPNTRVGQRVLHEIQQLLYPYLNLVISRNGIRIADLLYDSDSDAESWRSGGKPRRNAADIYIKEAQEGIHGGRGSKV